MITPLRHLIVCFLDCLRIPEPDETRAIGATTTMAQVQPDDLREASLHFAQSAAWLIQGTEEFARGAVAVDDAFGVMMESTEALGRYVAMSRQVVEGLETMATSLYAFGAALEASANTWQATDHRVAERMNDLVQGPRLDECGEWS